MDDYLERLTTVKERYPFAAWPESGLEQYTPKAIASFVAIFDKLIHQLAEMGEQAPEPEKITAFQQAVEALNALNDGDSGLIETVEREELCDLCNHIATTAGIDKTKYGGGEGPASEWRDW